MRSAALILLLAAAGLPSASLSSASQAPAQESAPSAALDALLSQDPGRALEAAELAVMLLGVEPKAVAQWLADMDQALRETQSTAARRAHLERLLVQTRQVPELIEGFIARPELPALARAHALAVGIEVLRTGRRPVDFRTLTDLLRATGDLPSEAAGSANQALRRCMREFASLRLFSHYGLEQLYLQTPAALSCAVLDGVAQSEDAEFAAQGLARLLGSVPESDPAVLNRLHLTLQAHLAGSAPSIADRVETFLQDPRPFARQEAAACLGRTGARSHVEALIERLGDDSTTVRSAAQTALHQLTGMSLPPDPDRWRQWFARQLEWWQARGQGRLDELSLATRSEQLEILREVCTKRLYHEEVSAYLSDLLDGDDPQTKCLALSALGTLRSPSALGLVRTFEHDPAPSVREAARAALRSYQQGEGTLPRRPAQGPR